MGLKYIEQVKSVILLLLILLSLTLTFTIWTFSPSYEANETPVVDIAIADKKKMEDIIKPYRLLYSHEEKLTGSTSPLILDKVFSSMKNWELQTVEPLKNKVSIQQINDFIRTPNRLTFFYPAEVPIKTFSNILSFDDRNLPNASFNRLVIDWNNTSEDEVHLYFINTIKPKVYKAHVDKVDRESFAADIYKQSINLSPYNEIERPGQLSLYASNNPENIMGFTYILEEIAPERFKNALFSNPSLVRSNLLGTSGKEFSDDSALMNVKFMSIELGYVHPSSESDKAGNPADLIQSTVNFVNEHNGWTDDYRFSRINPATSQVSYQLYLYGVPVFSKDTSTEITQLWGVDRVYRYNRPYYTLNESARIKTREVPLSSGQATYDLISTISNINMSSVDEILVGYNLTRDDEQPLLNLEPSWYYLINGQWNRVSPELLGGGKYGLE
ncbi:two-component system activity regulator YycH [Bacillus sp. Cr_A10]|uniref:YycH family regulatory protein n=1 Tax=Bacillus sp. Cr_A10 TaxID=3033993 RepID=UPI0023DABEA5|nr:two-component system activity regulator YycH [Bacillus sp. Cr_A10]MDF2067486.1 two-component system activity regulator YycH [Bacillus sp. Cr_A10]